MRDNIEQIRSAGADLVIIGNGAPLFASAFQEDLNLDCTVLCDQELTSYRAAGLRRGRVELLSPRVLSNGLRAWQSGARQTGVEGDPWQLGGVFVLRPDGATTFAQRSAEAGDHPSVEDILAALGRDQPALLEEVPNSEFQKLLGKGLSLLVNPTIALSFDRTGFGVHSLAFDPGDLDVDLSQRSCLVTGANAGIGFETALALADLGARVVLGCRSPARGKAAATAIRKQTGNRRVEVLQLDMADTESIREAASKLSKRKLDVVVHNAGLLPDERAESPQGFETTYAVHVVGPYLLTQLLAPTLEKSEDARVILVSSGGMYSQALSTKDLGWEERSYDGVAAYAQTKRMQVVLAENLAGEFAETSITVSSMHPGWAATDGVKTSLPSFWKVMGPLLRTPAEGADTVVWLAAAEPPKGQSGLFWFDRQPRRTHLLPWTQESAATRDVFRRRLEADTAAFLGRRGTRPAKG